MPYVALPHAFNISKAPPPPPPPPNFAQASPKLETWNDLFSGLSVDLGLLAPAPGSEIPVAGLRNDFGLGCLGKASMLYPMFHSRTVMKDPAWILRWLKVMESTGRSMKALFASVSRCVYLSVGVPGLASDRNS